MSILLQKVKEDFLCNIYYLIMLFSLPIFKFSLRPQNVIFLLFSDVLLFNLSWGLGFNLLAAGWVWRAQMQR